MTSDRRTTPPTSQQDQTDVSLAVELCDADSELTIDAHALLGSSGTLRIRHVNTVYVLRLTRNDKLLLTQ